MRFVKVQQKNFLENVISDADYKFFKAKLKKDGHNSWYFVVWFLTATGARVSELLQIKAEHVQQGYLDIYSKGGQTATSLYSQDVTHTGDKLAERERYQLRVYIPESLR